MKTVQVQFLVSFAHGKYPYPAGRVAEIPEEDAVEMFAAGCVVILPQQEDVRTATVEPAPAETATAYTKKKKG